MLKEFFHDILQLQPTFRSFIGDKSANKDYENIASPMFQDAYKKVLMKYKARLDQDRKTVHLDMLTLYWIIHTELEKLHYKTEWMYITSHDNPILDFIVDDTYIYPLKNARDVSDLISRTRKRIPLIKDLMKAMQEGVEEDLTLPKMVCKRVIQQIKKLLKNQSYYIKIPNHLEKLKEEYTQMINTEYVPVLYELLEFLKHHVRFCRNSIGLCYVKDGKERYRNMIKEYTTLDMTPEEVFEFGKSELKRMYKEFYEMKPAVLHAFGFKNAKTGVVSNQELFQRIQAKDSEYDTPSEILHAYKLVQEKIRKNILPKYFHRDVKPYNVKKIPKITEDSSTTAYYYPPSMKSNRRGTVFINTSFAKANPKYVIDVLSLHEGIPGHHYQYQLMKQRRLPLYRIYGGDNDAYSEGWALYCESFMDGMDTKARFGRWIYSMLRTVRLIIDTGVHYYGWSYKRALQFMIRHIPLNIEELKSELERYICDPGQAVSYKIGEQFFLIERDEYLKNKLGSIKDFHKEVLDCGPLPLQILQYKLRHRLIC